MTSKRITINEAFWENYGLLAKIPRKLSLRPRMLLGPFSGKCLANVRHWNQVGQRNSMCWNLQVRCHKTSAFEPWWTGIPTWPGYTHSGDHAMAYRHARQTLPREFRAALRCIRTKVVLAEAILVTYFDWTRACYLQCVHVRMNGINKWVLCCCN